jgi:hypothetical protein
MQTYFRESSGSVIHPVTISSSYFDLLAASAITWQDNEDIFLRVKVNQPFQFLQTCIPLLEIIDRQAP